MWSVLQYNEECPRGDNDHRGLEGHVHHQRHREPEQRISGGDGSCIAAHASGQCTIYSPGGGWPRLSWRSKLL